MSAETPALTVETMHKSFGQLEVLKESRSPPTTAT